MNRTKRIPALIAGMFLVAACAAPKPPLLKEPSRVVSRVHAETVQSCAYRGRIGVSFEDDMVKGGFKALVWKTCNDELTMKVLGMFNQVAYDITYDPVNGVAIEALGGADDRLDSSTLTEERVRRVLSFMRVPLFMPDATWEMLVYRRTYLFINESVKVVVNDRFRITAINGPGFRVSYAYDQDGTLSSLEQVDTDGRVELTFFGDWQ